MGAKSLNNENTAPLVSKYAVDAFREHKPLLLFSVGFYFLTYAFLILTINYNQLDIITLVYSIFTNSVMFSFIVLSVFLVLHLLKKKTDENTFKFCYRILRENIFTDENIWRILFGVISLSFTMAAFLVLKDSIPKIIPFSYDETFEQLDRTLHFGYQPWELLQPILGYKWVTLVIQRTYYLWFFVIYFVFYWQVGTQENKQLRMQLLFSFLACWAFLGGVMATLLSSAGPIFYEDAVQGSPQTYAPALAYLEGINKEFPMYMFEVKQVLWDNYKGLIPDSFVKGISAMPSMHVSLAFLLILFGWKKSKAWGIALTMFGLMIFLGSIHLLWHYAIDGYVSIIATTIIWLIAGKISRSIYKNDEAEITT